MTDIETDAVERTCIELDNYSFAASNLGVQDKMRLCPKRPSNSAHSALNWTG